MEVTLPSSLGYLKHEHQKMTDEEIIHSLRAVDAKEVRAALDAFFNKYLHQLMRALRYRLEKIGAGTLTQDAFAEGAMRFIFQVQEGEFERSTIRELSAYFLQIAYYSGIEEYRKQGKWKITDLQGEDLRYYQDYQEMAALQLSIEKAVQEAIGKLKGDCPKVLSLHLLHEHGHKSAAIMEAFNLTEDAAKSKVKRCKDQLETYLKAHPDQLDTLGG